MAGILGHRADMLTKVDAYTLPESLAPWPKGSDSEPAAELRRVFTRSDDSLSVGG